MKRIMACPKCKHTSFNRQTYEAVEIYDDGESLTDEVINDVEYKYTCRNCDEDVTEEEMIALDELEKLIKEKTKDGNV